jgi:serine/threonine protein kinase
MNLQDSSKQIGDYLRLEIIGEGTYSKVYKGIKKSDGLPVAIKKLKFFKS